MKFRIILMTFLFLCISNILISKEYIIGFGSCIDQNFPQPIWGSIENENVDAFFFLGDNVYGDHPSGDLQKLKKSYSIQSTKFPKWLEDKKVISIWDDHDYGINDGGGDFINKRDSQKLFLDFWKIPINDIRYQRDGLYHNELINLEGFLINIIVLDTRFFRSKLNATKAPYISNNDPETTILGEKQWRWLESALLKEADLTLILSSIQVLAKEHIFEKWNLFPHERSRLINLLNSNKSKTIILSGDRHKGGLYEKGSLKELTSSSLNKPTLAARLSRTLKVIPNSMQKQLIEMDSYLKTKIYNYENFGLIKIDTKNKQIEISLNDIDGNQIFSELI